MLSHQTATLRSVFLMGNRTNSRNRRWESFLAGRIFARSRRCRTIRLCFRKVSENRGRRKRLGRLFPTRKLCNVPAALREFRNGRTDPYSKSCTVRISDANLHPEPAPPERLPREDRLYSLRRR